MYYHTSSELGVDIAQRLQLQEDELTKKDNALDNCGKMSPQDSLREFYLTENRVINFINELLNKVTEVKINPLVSISFMSKNLNISEDIIVFILKKNGLEITTVEEDFI